MSIIDSWIPKIAKKNFSETINWIDAFVVGLLGLLLAILIYLDTTPVDISIPVKVVDATHLSIDQDFIEAIPKQSTLTLKNKEKRVSIKIIHRSFAAPRHILLTTSPLPFEKNDSLRLVIFRKTILNMLLRTKAAAKE